MDERKLKTKLKKITAIFSIISVLILVCGMFASISLNHIFQLTIQEQTYAQIDDYVLNINRKFDADFQSLETLASFMTENGEPFTDAFVNGLYDANQKAEFLYMVYMDKSGVGIRITGDEKIETDVYLNQLSEKEQTLIQEVYYKNQNTVSELYYDMTWDDEIMSCAVPVYDESKGIQGILFASRSIDIISEIMNEGSSLSSASTSALLDSNGAILTGSERVVSSGLDSLHNWESITEQVKNQMLTIVEQQRSGNVSFTINGVECYALIEPLGVGDFSVIVIDSKDGVNDPLYLNMILTHATNVIPLILSVACIYYGYRQMKKNSKELLRLAYYDRLTGAYNMEKFEQMLEDSLEKKQNYSIVGINIRHFKFINELFGTEQGNRLLCYIKFVLEQNCKGNEFFCRESADLFFLLLEETNHDVITKRVEQMMLEIGSMVLNQHQKYPIMLYCGVAFTEDIEKGEKRSGELITRVMFALKRAKRGGKKNIWFYDLELHKSEQLQNYIESHMQQALKDQEYRLFLQPKINLNTGELGGAEALVRWITKEGKMIFPDQFIPLFEENGFCTQLDLYMVEQACKQLREWHNRGFDMIHISVNQSKLLFYEDGYVEQLCRIVEKYDIPAKYITLEILEGLAMSNVDALNQRIAQLKEHGFLISMDDFGSGYSSLNTLGNLDIDELKLDRGFLMAASKKGGERQRLIMEQIITLAKRMNIATVAEGVETVEDEKMIRKQGCDYGQGYYYSRPISALEFGERYIIKPKSYLNHEE